MLKSFLLATAFVAAASYAEAAQGAGPGQKGAQSSAGGASSYSSSYRYYLHKRRIEARNAAALKAKSNKLQADQAAINAGMQQSRDKANSQMNAAQKGLSNSVISGTCRNCR